MAGIFPGMAGNFPGTAGNLAHEKSGYPNSE
jgi:hypothetical protein